MWRAPALALAAEGFLLTVALDPDVEVTGRAVAAALAAVIIGMSLQLAARHRFLSELDRMKMREIEERLGLERLSDRGWAFSGSLYSPPNADYPKETPLAGGKAFRIWQSGLIGVLILNLVVLGFLVVGEVVT